MGEAGSFGLLDLIRKRRVAVWRGHASETDSGPLGGHLTFEPPGSFGHGPIIRKRRVTARRGHASETAEPQQDSDPNGWPFGLQSRCRLGTFEPAKSKGDVGTLGTLRTR